MIPEMPLFLTFNVALVRKGMDASHSGPGLTAADNFDQNGEWKGMHFDIAWVRVYQDDSQGETRGLNPPITYEIRKKLLANRVTCNLIPELRCLIKNSTAAGESYTLSLRSRTRGRDRSHDPDRDRDRDRDRGRTLYPQASRTS